MIVPTASSAHVAKDPTREQAWRFTIPTNPQYSTNVTSAPLGSIGVMISGAVLFSPYEGDANTVAMASNFTITDASGITASFVDACAGHPTPLEGAPPLSPDYPTALPQRLIHQPDPRISSVSPLDGFPIYGARDIDGSPVPVEFLDQCNGIDSPTTEFPRVSITTCCREHLIPLRRSSVSTALSTSRRLCRCPHGWAANGFHRAKFADALIHCLFDLSPFHKAHTGRRVERLTDARIMG